MSLYVYMRHVYVFYARIRLLEVHVLGFVVTLGTCFERNGPITYLNTFLY